MTSPSLLAIFAHPDDEAFGMGGTLARYAAQGARVTLVCATRGEAGEISDPALATPETLAVVREMELREAAQALGLTELIFLDYRDSGMAGTPENADPRAFMNAPGEAVVERLVGIIRRVEPQVVVTFDPDGGYGHPDHIAAYRHTVAAVQAAGDAALYPEQGTPWQPDRLFYMVFPRSFFQQMREQMIAAGMDTSQWDEVPVLGWPDEQIHATLDVSQWVAAKLAAVNSHRTQFGPDNPMRRMPQSMMLEMMSREHFALAWPAPKDGLRLDDLFDGIAPAGAVQHDSVQAAD